MPVSQIVTCDCCADAVEDSSVLHCMIVTQMDAYGNVTQKYYGKACGCEAQIASAIATAAAAEQATPHEQATP